MIALPAASPVQENGFLAIGGDFQDFFAGLGIPSHRTQGDFQDHIGSLRPCFESGRTVDAGIGHDMLAVFEVKEGPKLGIAPQDDVTATAPITPVRTSFGRDFVSVKMHGTGTTAARSATDFDIIDEISFGHGASGPVSSRRPPVSVYRFLRYSRCHQLPSICFGWHSIGRRALSWLGILRCVER